MLEGATVTLGLGQLDALRDDHMELHRLRQAIAQCYKIGSGVAGRVVHLDKDKLLEITNQYCDYDKAEEVTIGIDNVVLEIDSKEVK